MFFTKDDDRNDVRRSRSTPDWIDLGKSTKKKKKVPTTFYLGKCDASHVFVSFFLSKLRGGDEGLF